MADEPAKEVKLTNVTVRSLIRHYQAIVADLKSVLDTEKKEPASQPDNK